VNIWLKKKKIGLSRHMWVKICEESIYLEPIFEEPFLIGQIWKGQICLELTYEMPL
tara:strand:- start:2091 stop:2258 length:168 start_codon:yes stop_codon:yes gene_type:complete